jgi:hypothetical protein
LPPVIVESPLPLKHVTLSVCDLISDNLYLTRDTGMLKLIDGFGYMGKLIKNHFFTYLFEVVIGIVIILLSVKAFAVYALIMIVIKLDIAIDYLSKSVKAAGIMNEIFLETIMAKNKVSEDDLNQAEKRVGDRYGEVKLMEMLSDVKKYNEGRT